MSFLCRGKDVTGKSSAKFELNEGASTQDFVGVLLQTFPAIEKVLATSLLAVNHNYIESPVILKEGDEIAVIPPISGG